MIIKIDATGPRASGKSTILDLIESSLKEKGFNVKRTGKDGHSLIAKFNAKVMFAETIYTVPLHVGRNVEVPEGTRVTFYDPKKLLDRPSQV